MLKRLREAEMLEWACYINLENLQPSCVSQKGLEGTSLTKARNMLVKGRTHIVRSPVISVLCRPGLTEEDAKVGLFPQEGEINCLNFQRLGLAAGGGVTHSCWVSCLHYYGAMRWGPKVPGKICTCPRGIPEPSRVQGSMTINKSKTPWQDQRDHRRKEKSFLPAFLTTCPHCHLALGLASYVASPHDLIACLYII